MNDNELLTILTTHRRFLHAVPEIGNSEFKTSAYLKEQLEKTCPDALESLDGTGIKCVYLSSDKNAKTYGFRSDIDALPIEEKSICPIHSEHAGMMHACGHDGHMATLLTFASIVGQKKREGTLKHNIMLLFQPAEETTGGALPMIQQGALEHPHVDYMFGMHVMPHVAKGSIALSPGDVMASNNYIILHFHGKSAHGAQPHNGCDAAGAMASAYVALQGYLTHAVPASESAVLTFGKMNAGTQRNIVAAEASMEGILRTFNRDLQKQLISGIRAVCENTAASFGVTVTMETECDYATVHNDDKLFAEFADCVPNRVEQTPITIAEDYSYFSTYRPSLFAFVGVGDELRRSALHTNTFDLDEAALLPAVHTYTNIIEQ